MWELLPHDGGRCSIPKSYRLLLLYMIRTPYKTKYGKDLVNELKRECSGDFEDVMVGLMETPTKYDVLQLHKAVKVNSMGKCQ
uniref:Annexin n=1 Tax=Ascaris lumbricoides TaxID=6252 RepID=A0A0M3HLN5_ASCLU